MKLNSDGITLCIEQAISFLEQKQNTEGSWQSDYGGPLFLLPLYIITYYICEKTLDENDQKEIIRYWSNHQNTDGGWGLHIEGESSLLSTILIYVSQRLMGISNQDPKLKEAKNWFDQQGGVLYSPYWTKFILSLLNLYDYSGLFPIQPEQWLLPYFLPFHPARFACSGRMMILPMSYLYGIKAQVKPNDLLLKLRQELYGDKPYNTLNWWQYYATTATTDCYKPFSFLVKIIAPTLRTYEKYFNKKVRKKALNYVLKLIYHEDLHTHYIGYSILSKLFNMIVWHFAKPQGEELQKHFNKINIYHYYAQDGLKLNGNHSSEIWDTAFSIQVLSLSHSGRKQLNLLNKAYQFLETQQIKENSYDFKAFYRHPPKGGWAFSNGEYGWITSDCTAESLIACLLIEPIIKKTIPFDRIKDAVICILSLQNSNGGWAAYELQRGPNWLELFNISSCFGDFMLDYPCVECTASCIRALTAFQARYPSIFDSEIKKAIKRGQKFILSLQRSDGSWKGSWGICFTYGTWFAIEGLVASGMEASHPAIEKAASFLLTKQLPDGGWGETIKSCTTGFYHHAEKSQAVMTSWALLTLLSTTKKHTSEIKKAIDFLKRTQNPNGSWPDEHIAGVTYETIGLHYDHYLKVFPLWALSAFAKQNE